MSLEKIKEILALYSQQHLLDFYEELSEEQREELLQQIANIDFEFMKKLYNHTDLVINANDKIEPMGYKDKADLSEEEIKRYKKIGEEIIRNGQFAFATLAGGQGTRLGHNGPKGTFMLDVKPAISLFEIMCNNLKRAKKKYDVYIPWYIMTSNDNHEDTTSFFEQNNYFGYPKDKIVFFKQQELPMMSQDGKVLLESKFKVKEAPDGHGGILQAIFKNNIIVDIEKQNIKWLFIGGIDNVLLKMVDPLFIGMAQEKNVKLACKSIVKACPEEKVGVFCKRNGRPSVVEYTEITQEMSNLRDSNGELLYGESHILCNMFSIESLKLIQDEKLPYHIALKKCSYIDENGILVIPEQPNAYKFETFIFDAFSKFEDMLILRTSREEEFAPVKNKEGADSPETAKELYLKYWSREKNNR